MPITITDRDMRDQVERSLEGWTGGPGSFDVPAIVEALQARYGLTHIDEIPSDDYWAIVEKHDTRTTDQEGTDQ
jgi:hypothetical protein